MKVAVWIIFIIIAIIQLQVAVWKKDIDAKCGQIPSLLLGNKVDIFDSLPLVGKQGGHLFICSVVLVLAILLINSFLEPRKIWGAQSLTSSSSKRK